MDYPRRTALATISAGIGLALTPAVALLTSQPATAADDAPPDERLAALNTRAQQLNILELGAPPEALSPDIDPALTYSDLLTKSLARSAPGDLKTEMFSEELGKRIADLVAVSRDAVPELLEAV